ncbi:MAG: hydrogenase expression protein [Deltaproteobacteria bacterium]|nr:MAG: hydrogenase expression protein [Deltaproteobacteria bacterium]
MPDRTLRPGKLPADLLAELLAAGGPAPPELRLGPAVGEDACAIEIPAGALIAAADPITLTGSGVGAHAVVINANDVAVMGVRPRWFLATILLPDGSPESLAREIFDAMRAALDAVGAALVGGHTEVTPAVRQPVIAGQMLGLAPDGHFVRTGGVRPGDVVVQVGTAPVEGAAVLCTEAAGRLGALDAETRERAARALAVPGISVVEAALAAAALGATALHDPTEGGLATGLLELADASEVALCVERDAVLWFEPGVAVCRALGADPWGTLASGALLATFDAAHAQAACAELERRGFAVRAIGRAEPGRGVRFADGTPVPRFSRDEVARLLR